jgi:tRNA (adenine37-N6)-methyltransferase
VSKIVMEPIGYVRGGRTTVADDNWADVVSAVEFEADQVDASGLQGLDTFSHVEVVFVFDRVDPEAVCRGKRHPRGRADWPEVGILAQRAKDRPNRIGVTVCALRSVEGLAIEVVGLDAVEGSPVLDVKPYMSGFTPRGERREPQWAKELMGSYWKSPD